MLYLCFQEYQLIVLQPFTIASIKEFDIPSLELRFMKIHIFDNNIKFSEVKNPLNFILLNL